MKRTFSLMVRAVIVLTAMWAAGSIVYAQGGGAASLSGVVVDSTGGVMPGVDIVAKNTKNNAVNTAITDSEGRFTIPALEPGIYSVTVSLSGFKTVLLPDVTIITATPSTIRVKLEVGGLEETVTVTGGTEIIQTQTSTVATTLTTTQMTKLPLATRNSMDFLANLPGVDTTAAVRNSTVMGLRQSATNITIDGINVQDNYLKSTDGFFARISPRLDAIEEVTVSTANPGAESAGQGAVQVRFTTRSGTNQYQGSAYWFLRRPEWNTPYWFNERDGLPKDQVKVDTYGARFGGPIVIPSLFDGHDKAFFFFNYEEFRQPGSIVRNKTILSPQAQQGVFQYNTAGGVQQVNLFAVAAATGNTASADPAVAKLLGQIQASTAITGSLSELTDPNLKRFSFSNLSDGIRRYPTTRVDVNLTKNHRVGVSYYAQQYNSSPDTLNSVDPAFPGFANKGDQYSLRWSVTGNMRSTLGTKLVNEFRMGATGGPVQFSKGIDASQFADTNGFGLNLNAAGISNAYVGRNPNTRDAPTYLIEDTLNWLKGSHSLSIGGTWTQINFSLETGSIVPTISFGVASADPAQNMFNTTNFPGASSTDLSNARNIYAVLTGRVSAINASAVLDGSTGKYVYMGRATHLARMRETGLFISDSWKVRPGLTVNAGVRHELQLPFVPLNDYYSMASDNGIWGISGPNNLFKPGTLTGTPTTFVNFKKGMKAFNTDWNNFAPSAGVAWTPAAREGFLGKLMGHDGDFVIRGGYSMSFNREGMATFENIFSFNPGGSIDATRSATIGNLTSSYPLLLRSGNLGAPPFQEAPAYPLTPGITESVNVFDPDTEVPYAHSWTMGVQRAVTRDMAVELRYVGTRGRNGWANGGRDYNEVNVVNNGFLDEFKRAQNNLLANIAAGLGNTFAYTGAPGTAPLPILLGAYNGLPSSSAANAANYSGSNWTNTTFINWLAKNNPQPVSQSGGAGFASTGSNGLIGNSTFRNNLIAAGYPKNLFIVNPDLVGGAFMTTNGQLTSDYDAMQIEVRKRMSHGFLFSGNYTMASAKLSSFFSHRYDMDMIKSSDTLEHAIKFNWVYELPFGKGRKFGSGANALVNGLIGGWDFTGSGRIQSGRVFDYGNVRLVGMSESEFHDMFKIYKRPDSTGKIRVYTLPQDVIDNTIKAFSASATSATGYGSLGAPSGKYLAPASGPDCVQAVAGDCAPRHLYVNGPWFGRYDMSLAKRIGVGGRSYATFTLDVLNVFDNINFTPTTTNGVYAGATPASYEVTAGYRDISNTQDPGGRVIQLSFRFTF
ncbi:MAG TPA: TonB-dependent receptor [Vicinamibacterales bacterium]